MNGGVEFIIKALDLATEPFRRVSQAIEQSTQRFTDMKRKADVLPSSINDLKSKLDNLQTERGTTTSIQRVKELNKEIGRTSKEVSKLENMPPQSFISRLRESSGILGTMGGLVAAAFSISAITSFTSGVIDTTSKIEAAQKSFEVLVGNKGRGQRLSNDLNKLQQDTILTPAIFDNAKTMLGFGMNVEKVIPTIKELGDVSMGNAEKMNSLTLAFSQTQSAGKLMGQDLLQYVNAGFNPLHEISLKTGKSMGELRKEMEKGNISSKMVEDAFKAATSAGGPFFHMMDEMNATTSGKLAQLDGSWETFKQSIGEGIKPVVNYIIDKFSHLLTKLKPIGDWLKEHPAFVKWLAITIGIASVALTGLTIGMWLFNAALWANPITWVVIAVIALSAAVAWAIVKFDGWGTSLSALWSIIKSFTSITIIGFKEMCEDIGFNVGVTWLKIKDFFQWIGEKASNVFESIKKLSQFDFAGAFEAANRKITTSASKEIEDKQKAHIEALRNFNKETNKEVNNIGEQWKKVSIHAAPETAVEKAVKEITKPEKKGVGLNNTGKDTADKISSGGSRPTTINIVIQKLTGIETLHTSNLKEGSRQAASTVVEDLQMALLSVNPKQTAN